MANYSEKEMTRLLHMKATMIKVYLKDLFAKHGDVLAQLKINVNNGLADLHKKIAGHPKEDEILANIEAVYASRPGLAMVDSSKDKLERDECPSKAATPPKPKHMGTFGVMDGLASDGALAYKSAKDQKPLDRPGVRQR